MQFNEKILHKFSDMMQISIYTIKIEVQIWTCP